MTVGELLAFSSVAGVVLIIVTSEYLRRRRG